MAETKIQWADYTFNPWVGCQRVSPGCEHCYAEAYDKRVGGVPVSQRPLREDHRERAPLLRWGPSAPRTRTSPSYWKQPLKWDREAQAAGQRRKVFCASLADVFEDRTELAEWRDALFSLIDATPHLDWLLLTKRPENISRLMPAPAVGHRVVLFGGELVRPNVWLGTTVEDQQRANERIPELIKNPAAVRFLSCEPLLEALDLSKWLDEDETGFVGHIDWIIIGGESGPGARPFDLEWARSLVAQCRDGGRAEAAPFMKQIGARPVVACDKCSGSGRVQLVYTSAPTTCQPCLGTGQLGWPLGHRSLFDTHGGDPAEWPLDLRVREFPEVRP